MNENDLMATPKICMGFENSEFSFFFKLQICIDICNVRFNRKSHFFQKKAKKINFFNSVKNEKKISEEIFATEFFYPLGESMFKKSAKSEMVTGSLVDSYKKPLLSYFCSRKLLKLFILPKNIWVS
jgi:hypothetical protein